MPASIDEPIVEGSATIVRAGHARSSDQSGSSEREAIELSRAPAYFTFDVAAMVNRGLSVERATLVFSPHGRWQTAPGHRQIAVHALASPLLQDSNTQPLLAEDAVCVATIARELRAPIRLDVTSIAREWLDGARPPGGLAVTADATGIIVQGASALQRDDRPRLELVTR